MADADGTFRIGLNLDYDSSVVLRPAASPTTDHFIFSKRYKRSRIRKGLRRALWTLNMNSQLQILRILWGFEDFGYDVTFFFPIHVKCCSQLQIWTHVYIVVGSEVIPNMSKNVLKNLLKKRALTRIAIYFFQS